MCRYGGEEFVLVFPERSVSDASQVLSRIQEELVLSLAGGNAPPFTASFGVSYSDEHAASPEELMSSADGALFQAKRAGRNQIAVGGLC